MTRPNYAIVGGFGAGKTTLADALVNEWGYTRVSLAGRLKKLAADTFGHGYPIEKNGLYWVKDEDGLSRGISGRQVLQELGQAVKSLDRDFWIRLLDLDIQSGEYGDGPFVCDDCRFPYEAAALSRMGFVIAKLDTPDDVRMMRYQLQYGRYPTEEELNHPSETGVRDIVPDILVSGTQPVEQTARLLAA